MGTVSIGDPLWPGAGTFPNSGPSSVYPGQGDQPVLQAFWTNADVAAPAPGPGQKFLVWNELAGDRVRSCTTSRGRETELEEHDAGTFTATLANRDRAFDPTYASSPYFPNVRPGNRLWLREQFNGKTNSMILGYVESYHQRWPGPGMSDAVVDLQGSDELKRLTRALLPVTDPPRDTYGDVVEYETPDGYWPCSADAAIVFKINAQEGGKDLVFDATVGGSSFGSSTATPILGDTGGEIDVTNGAIAATDVLVTGDPSVVQGINEFALGFWFQYNVTALGTKQIISGPLDGGGLLTYDVQLTAAGALNARARNNGGATVTATSSALTANTWYHVVVTIQGGSLRIYLNGVQSASTAFTPPFVNSLSATAKFKLGDTTATTQDFHYAQIFTDRTGMTAARVLAQYTAGASRGFLQQNTGQRIGAVLDSISHHAPRLLRAGARNILPSRMRGQAARDELRDARTAEAVDSVLFVAKDGTITFLDANHRSVSPWNTIQAVFADDDLTPASELPYQDFDTDYSDTYTRNVWNVTREGGLVQTASDATSISQNGPLPESLSTRNISDIEAAAIATAMLAKYKDALLRGTKISLTTDDPNVTEAVFALELGDRIRVLKKIPKGLGSFDQEMFIQKIEIKVGGGDYPDQKPWTIDLAVSPL